MRKTSPFEPMKQFLSEFKSEMRAIFTTINDVYDLIYSWRNDMLHGSKMKQFYHAVVLNMISLLLLDSLQPSYGAIKEK